MFQSNPNVVDANQAAAQDPQRRFRLMTIQELMHQPPLRWVVENHIPAGGLAVLYGAPGGGKSFVALDLALSIAAGVPWLKVEPVMQGAVVYIAAEGSAGLAMRLAAWKAAHDGN
jgi:RecA-family ATPase